jgi:hypothetical protein
MNIKGLRIRFPIRADRRARPTHEVAMSDDLERRLLSAPFGLFR